MALRLSLPNAERWHFQSEPGVLVCENVEAEVAELKSRGVVFEKYDLPGTDANGITTAGGVKAAWFKDSEGNILAIIQTLEEITWPDDCVTKWR